MAQQEGIFVSSMFWSLGILPSWILTLVGRSLCLSLLCTCYSLTATLQSSARGRNWTNTHLPRRFVILWSPSILLGSLSVNCYHWLHASLCPWPLPWWPSAHFTSTESLTSCCQHSCLWPCVVQSNGLYIFTIISLCLTSSLKPVEA